jgi:uncharacterized protein YfaS (alpha-2-macroglobulin family)
MNTSWQQLRLPASILLVLAILFGLWFTLGQEGLRTLPTDLTEIQKVQADSDLYFVFNDEMDQDSVEANLVIPDGVRGEISWKDNTMVFRPDSELDSGAKYAFSVLKKAQTAKKDEIGTDLKFNFIVGGIPTLVSRIPAIDATEVTTDVRLTLVFDRPMIPLTQVQGKAAEARLANWPVTISPAIDGRWRWLGTTSIVYEPEEEFLAATRYTVNVPAGIKTVNDDITEEDFTWSFETPRPQATYVRSAADHGRYGPNSEILIEFNLPMDLGSVNEHVTLTRIGEPGAEAVAPLSLGEGDLPDGSEQVRIKSARYHVEENDDEKETREDVIVIEANSSLDFNSQYQVTIREDIRSTAGSLGSIRDFNSSFQSAGDLVVSSADYNYYRLEFDFSNPIDGETLKKNISISPEPLSWEEEDKELPEWSNGAYIIFRPELKPRTTYTFTFDTGLTDVFGQKLKEPYTYEFTTAPLSPRVFIHSKGEFGLFEKDKPPVFFLNAINVSNMELNFAPLSLNEFLQIKQETLDDYDYSPDLESLEGHQSFDIEPPKSVDDEWEVVEFEVGKQFGELKSGIYALTLQAPEYKSSYGDREPIIEEQYFALSNLALTLKYSGSKALVWLTDTQTGEAVDRARISFHALSGEVPLRGRTDKDGFFEAELPLEEFVSSYNSYNPEFYVTAEKDGDMTFVGSEWNNGMQAYNFGLNSDFNGTSDAQYRVQSYLYTERPIYRAGDTVNFKGVIRLRELATGEMFPPNSSRKANVIIEDARYETVYDETLDISEYGTFNSSFTIAEGGSLGDYRMEVQVTPENDISSNYTSHRFAVLAYRKPEFRVEANTVEDDYYDDQNIQFDLEGSYFFGAAMDGAEVSWRVRSTDYFFNRYTDGYYSFSLADSWCWWNCERETDTLGEGSGTLDEAGHLIIDIPVDLDDKALSQVVTLEADVTDPNNQVISGSVSVPVHKSEVYVGVRSKDYVVAPGEEASIEVVTVSPDGTPKANQSVTVKMYSRKWNSVKKKGVDGEYYYDNEPEDTFISQTSVRTNEAGKAVAGLEVSSGGQHRMVASVSDSSGREAVADTSVYVYSSTYVNWPRGNHDRVEIVADKPEYKVGDTAQLLVKSPFQGEKVKALVTVEREQIMSKQVITVESNAQAIEILITEEMLPNAFVSVVILKPREGETFNENGLDTGVPAFRIGYVKLLVDTEQKKDQVSILTDREKYGPGETVQVTIKTADWEGNPKAAEVSLGVVDLSVLALTGFQMPDLVKRFYAQRGLGINTAQTLLYLVERFKPGSKGGGGANPETKKRGNFKDTAYWNPAILTNDSGEASLSFDLPDNLTTWQLLAISNTKDSTFGAVTKEIIETKKVILRPVRPRFAVADDEIKLGAIVHNFLEEEKTFTVTLKGSGFEPMGEMTQTITLASDSQGKLQFPVLMTYSDKATFTFKAETDGGVDEIEESIPVYVFGTPQSVATAGNTEEGLIEKVLVPSVEDAKEGNVSLTLSPTLASYLPDGLEYIVNFPYGCAEQTMSSFLPSVVMKGLQGFDAFHFVDDERLENIVSTGVQKLYGFQRPDGGFGYWVGSSRSYPYLSAYILFGMHQAQTYGYTVDSNVVSRVRSYLDGVLRSQDLKDRVSLATRAYILFVLSESGAIDASLVNNLYDKQDELPIFAQSMLSMTLQNVGTKASKNKAQAVLEDILETTKVDARGTHFEESTSRGYYGGLMHTNTRTTAFVLQNLVRLQPEHPLIPRVVRYLLAVRENGHWDTTQSTSITLIAFMEFLSSTGELDGDFSAIVKIDDETVLEKDFNADNILTQEVVNNLISELNQGELNEFSIGKSGVGRLYYDLVMDYFYLADNIPPAEEGLGIFREFEPVAVASEGTVTVGDTYKVTLSMSVPQDRHFVAVESPLPAGLELIDLRLKTTQQSLYDEGLNKSEDPYQWWNNLWYFTHTEFRDDRLFLFADYLPTGVYEYEFLVRATTPGKFRHRPARIYEMYFPETFGQTSGEWFTVEGK